MASTTADNEAKWGRVLICGGVDWASNGRKDRTVKPDLPDPRTLRSICHLKITKLIAGSAANYAIAIDNRGVAHMFGKIPSSALGPTPDGIVPGQEPISVTPRSAGADKHVTFVGGAVGRSHALLVGSDGNVWGCGNNVVGQIGLAPKSEYSVFTKITGPWTKEGSGKVVQVSVGHTFSLFLTNTGQVYATGSCEYGQLGNGKTGERILKAGKTGFDMETPPRLVQGALAGKKIVQIASGNAHSLALDEDGHVYAWGYAGYCRLGLGDQKDRLSPTVVPSFLSKFEGQRGRDIRCGPSSSVVIDRSGTFYIAGKWKLTGDGSAGQAYTTFKKLNDLLGHKAIASSVGGCTHFMTSPADGGVMTIGFGQGCLYGELGIGTEAKSATKPTRIEALNGIDVIDIAAGAFFTLFLARPNSELSEIDRWPEHVDSPNICILCKLDEDDDDAPLECERCDMPYHKGCLTPPLLEIPEGEWFCPECEKKAEGDVGEDGENGDAAAAVNDLEGDQDVDEDEDEEDEEGSQRDDADDIPARIGTPAGAGVKRGPPSTGGSARKKR